MRILIGLIFLVFANCCVAQEGSAEFPSLAPGHVYLINRTNINVVFYLDSPNTERTEHSLQGNSAAEYSGTPDDTWFNIYVYTNKDGMRHEINYGLDSGTRHYFQFNNNGILDVYKLPPN